MSKKEIRQEMNSLLRSVSDIEFQKQGETVFNKLRHREWFQQSQRIAIYLNMPYELPTNEILKALLHPTSNKECFVPVISGDKMKMVRLKSWDDLYYNFKPNKWGISEPIDNRGPETDLDLIICPGLAFDRYGNRLGRGKGYYDLYLTDVSPKTIGICLKEQMITSVPVDSQDIKMNYVITG